MLTKVSVDTNLLAEACSIGKLRSKRKRSWLLWKNLFTIENSANGYHFAGHSNSENDGTISKTVKIKNQSPDRNPFHIAKYCDLGA